MVKNQGKRRQVFSLIIKTKTTNISFKALFNVSIFWLIMPSYDIQSGVQLYSVVSDHSFSILHWILCGSGHYVCSFGAVLVTQGMFHLRKLKKPPSVMAFLPLGPYFLGIQCVGSKSLSSSWCMLYNIAYFSGARVYSFISFSNEYITLKMKIKCTCTDN